MKLRPQSRIDAEAGLVSMPQIVAERFDDVIGGHADVRRPLFDHLEYAVQHSAHAAEARVDAVRRSAGAVEMAEQLVRAVDEVDDHAGPQDNELLRCNSIQLTSG